MNEMLLKFKLGDTAYVINPCGDVFEVEVEEYRIKREGIKVWCKNATCLINESELYHTKAEALYNYYTQKEKELRKELLEVCAEIDKLPPHCKRSK